MRGPTGMTGSSSSISTLPVPMSTTASATPFPFWSANLASGGPSPSRSTIVPTGGCCAIGGFHAAPSYVCSDTPSPS